MSGGDDSGGRTRALGLIRTSGLLPKQLTAGIDGAAPPSAPTVPPRGRRVPGERPLVLLDAQGWGSLHPHCEGGVRSSRNFRRWLKTGEGEVIHVRKSESGRAKYLPPPQLSRCL